MCMKLLDEPGSSVQEYSQGHITGQAVAKPEQNTVSLTPTATSLSTASRLSLRDRGLSVNLRLSQTLEQVQTRSLSQAERLCEPPRPGNN